MTSPTFRIFVSSTFSDLKTERSALQGRVFPRPRELCQQYGARFRATDANESNVATLGSCLNNSHIIFLAAAL